MKEAQYKERVPTVRTAKQQQNETLALLAAIYLGNTQNAYARVDPPPTWNQPLSYTNYNPSSAIKQL